MIDPIPSGAHNEAMNPTMTPQQALQILDEATAPVNAGKITRGGYVQIEAALRVLAELAKPAPSLAEDTAHA